MAVQDPVRGSERSRVRVLTTWVIVLGIVVLGLAGWIAYDQWIAPDTASLEMDALLDDYASAWNEHDGEAFKALLTGSYVFETDGDMTGADRQATEIDNLEFYDAAWNVEVLDRIALGDGPWLVTSNDLFTGNTFAEDGEYGLSVYWIEEIDGELKVKRHMFWGFFD